MNLLIKLLLTGSFLFIISCDNDGKSVFQNKLKKILDNQKLILSRLDKLEKSQRDLASKVNSPAKPSQAENRPKADPNKVYDISIGNSFVQGNNNAKVTIIEWSDYF